MWKKLPFFIGLRMTPRGKPVAPKTIPVFLLVVEVFLPPRSRFGKGRLGERF
jgi:hypothetical protein